MTFHGNRKPTDQLLSFPVCPILTRALLAFWVTMHRSDIIIYPNEVPISKARKGGRKVGGCFEKVEISGCEKPIRASQLCVSLGLSLISWKLKWRQTEKGPSQGSPRRVRLIRGRAHLTWGRARRPRAAVISEQSCFQNQSPSRSKNPLQATPEYLPCAPCKNSTRRLDMPYELSFIYYHQALPFSVML